ncbi:MAG TPA: hypothetical protein VGC60_05430, partial [Pyrinomonadaceae bacterium]
MSRSPQNARAKAASSFQLTPEFLNQLRESGNWMIRLSKDGRAYNGFIWNPVGEWTEAQDWDSKPVCGRGLHGQGPGAWGFAHEGTRLELAETDPQRIVVGDNKIKTPRARILCTGSEALETALYLLSGYTFPGSLNLKKITHQLPATLQSIGGDVDLEGYQHQLPATLQSIGGDVDLRGYQHQLPATLQS